MLCIHSSQCHAKTRRTGSFAYLRAGLMEEKSRRPQLALSAFLIWQPQLSRSGGSFKGDVVSPPSSTLTHPHLATPSPTQPYPAPGHPAHLAPPHLAPPTPPSPRWRCHLVWRSASRSRRLPPSARHAKCASPPVCMRRPAHQQLHPAFLTCMHHLLACTVVPPICMHHHPFHPHSLLSDSTQPSPALPCPA